MESRFLNVLAKVCFLIILCSSIVQGSAQQADTLKKWNFLTDVYLMFPNMDGETGIGNSLTVPVDANPGDIFSKLKMAGMVYFEAKTEKWAITNDFVYMKLNQEVTPGKIIESGDVTAKEFIWEPAGFYKIVPFLEVGIGGRLTSLSTDINVLRNVFPPGTEAVSESGSKTWFDPILITRLSTNIKHKWLFLFRGDVGGFGIGSDLTWQLQAYAGYRFGKTFQLTGGYRILSIDYDKGTDKDRFIYWQDFYTCCLCEISKLAKESVKSTICSKRKISFL